MTRLLVLMGSGETAPTMVKPHRQVLERLGLSGGRGSGGATGSAAAVLLDTPYGFQANADELSARAQRYFSESVGVPVEVASFRHSDEVGTVAYEAAMALLRQASFVFAGPGSPTYALRQWRASSVPDALSAKLAAGGSGGCVTFASAAALTIGAFTVPVYEIYKVGAPPAWEAGLDLLGQTTGLSAAVIPHYDNAEGGTHDTRFCYLGESRLARMEAELPEAAFVLGVDEHTGLVLDLDTGRGSVVGNGLVTVRVGGRSATFPAGTAVVVEELSATAARLQHEDGAEGTPVRAASVGGSGAGSAVAEADFEGPGGQSGTGSASLLLDAVAGYEASFHDALARRDVPAAVQCLLDLEAEVHAWSADTPQADEQDRARDVLRSLMVRLGKVAETGARDPREVVGPYVEAMIETRRDARSEGRYADADAVRDRLVALGIEVQDRPGGTEWALPDQAGG